MYPHRDGYRDSITITARAGVPSTYVLDILDKGRVIYHRTYLRRAILSVPWDGTNDSRKVVLAGAYTLRITARGAEGTARTKMRKVVVSALRAVPKPFEMNFAAGTAMQAYSTGVTLIGSGTSVQIDGGDDPATPKDVELNLATFSRSLPPSALTPTSVTVYACTQHTNNTATNNAFVGYFSGPVDNPNLSAEWAYRMGDAPGCHAAKHAAPDFSVVNGALHFWVGNGSLPGNPWTVDSFKVTGISYVLSS